MIRSDIQLTTIYLRVELISHCVWCDYIGQEATIRHLSVSKLLPATSDYITYDGSMTQPGCQETVTWIIMNKPLYMSIHHVRIRFGHWLTLCTSNMHLLTYLLTT